MRKKLTVAALFAVLLSLLPIGPMPTASAGCPDYDNPCDVMPQEVPYWCKLTPFC